MILIFAIAAEKGCRKQAENQSVKNHHNKRSRLFIKEEKGFNGNFKMAV